MAGAAGLALAGLPERDPARHAALPRLADVLPE
jgi:hypothetical protein